jgi:TonB family protein
VQGTVALHMVVNEKGNATDVSVVSPLGFGLDERAQAAVARWEFEPGMKAGVPVKILAAVEVNFRLPGRLFDQKAERQRTAFNVALQNLNRADATLGSRQAQFYLGSRYEAGDGVPHELSRARQYYGLCATQGVALCQYRLGRLLYNAPERRERDYLQAIALFQLAAEQDFSQAKPFVSDEAPKLTARQSAWVNATKRQIVRK